MGLTFDWRRQHQTEDLCRPSARKGVITGMRETPNPRNTTWDCGNSLSYGYIDWSIVFLLLVPDMQAFIRVPDSDYPLPLGSWRPAAGYSPSQGLGSVQHGIDMLQDRIARPLPAPCEDSADQSAVDHFNLRAAVWASRFVRDELSTSHCINMKGFRKLYGTQCATPQHIQHSTYSRCAAVSPCMHFLISHPCSKL
jgi:hypothetical protein